MHRFVSVRVTNVLLPIAGRFVQRPKTSLVFTDNGSAQPDGRSSELQEPGVQVIVHVGVVQ